MRSNTSLLGGVFMGIALQARIFGVAKTEWKRAFTMLSHDKNNLWCKSKLESWTKSLTKMKSEVWNLKSEVWSLRSEVWGLKADGVVFVILTKILKIIFNL